MKLTPWFPVGTVPSRVGVYETRLPVLKGIGTRYSRWDGSQWSFQWQSIAAAGRDTCIGSQDKEWRGLAADPKDAK